MLKNFIKYLFYLTIIAIIFIVAIDLYISSSTKERIYSSVKKVPHRDVALLLGTAKYVRRGKINYFYKYRIDAAVKLFKSGKVDAILVSGDNATPYYNEPVRMRRDLIKQGVPKSKIYLDFAGFRTLDSVIRAKNIFGLKKYTIISQKFHLERALFLARASGADAIGFVAKDFKGTKAAIRMLLREYAARVKAFLDIYVLHTPPKFIGKFEKILIKENRE